MSHILTVQNASSSLERQPPTAIPPRTSSAAQHSVPSSHRRSKSATAGPSSASRALSFLKPKRRSAHRPRKTSGEMSGPSTNGHGLNGHGAEHEDAVNGIGEALIYGPEREWSASKENIIMGPYDYLFGHPGKDIRTQLIAAFNAWLHVPEPSLKIITDVVGMLHTASLLVDDVEDSSKLRRGIPVAHSIFGTAQTINSANYVYFLALHEIQKLNNPAAITIFTAELLNLHRGQGMDLYWRDSLTCPSEDDYLEMVSNKTGGLFRLAVKLMQAESASAKNCIPLVNAISLLFQILDDYQNLSSSKYTSQKGLAEDLTEGKFSFPVIHAIRADRSSKVLLNILKQKTTDDEVKKFAVGYLGERGSLGYTRGVLKELTARAMGLVEELEADDFTEHSNSAGDGSGAGDGNGERSGEGIRRILESLRVESPRASVHE